MADTDAISRVLADGYGLAGARLQRVLSGVATVNFVADADDGYRVFVKAYQPEADLATERAAIELSEFAGTRGVPTARVVWSVHGEHVHEDEQVAVSVWEFVAADGVENAGLACLQMMAVGTAVGRLHRVLATHPAAQPRQESGPLWDVGKATRKIERVLGALCCCATLDADFHAWATEVLRWRHSLMPWHGAMLERLPPLTSQVIHGDLALPNVLFRNDEVAAVIDFRPPSPRPVAWEVSRIGCDPRTILRGDDWVPGLAGLLAAYRDENPQVPEGDLVATVRVGLLLRGVDLSLR